jgi:Domain of unknown function (4846)
MKPRYQRYYYQTGLVFILLLFSCDQQAQPPAKTGENPYATVGAIPVPAGYHRIDEEHRPFAAWLRTIPLKKDRTVYLYDGSPKRNQGAQFAVLDVSVGHTDLQQCADAVMRLRAEYLYACKDFINIDFYTEQGIRLNFLAWANGGRVQLKGNRLINYTLSGGDHYCDSRACFDNYLNTVFSYCGTRTLEQQLVPVSPFGAMQAGDVLVKGGAPGHAMLVMDMAEDAAGHRVYLLAQSYMPAQDIHIVRNPADAGLGAWYREEEAQTLIQTPEWIFTTNQLRTWPKRTGRT